MAGAFFIEQSGVVGRGGAFLVYWLRFVFVCVGSGALPIRGAEISVPFWVGFAMRCGCSEQPGVERAFGACVLMLAWPFK